MSAKEWKTVAEEAVEVLGGSQRRLEMITPVAVTWLVWGVIMLLAYWKWESIWQPVPVIVMLAATVVFSLVGGFYDGLVGLLVPWAAYISALMYFSVR